VLNPYFVDNAGPRQSLQLSERRSRPVRIAAHSAGAAAAFGSKADIGKWTCRGSFWPKADGRLVPDRSRATAELALTRTKAGLVDCETV